MVRMTVLASGSKGNSSIIATNTTRILVDAGLSCRELLSRMESVGQPAESLDGIVITHEHSDHVRGLAVTARKLRIPVWFTKATHEAWVRWMRPRKRRTYAAWIAERKAHAASEANSDIESTPHQDLATLTGARDPSSLPVVAYFHAGVRFHIGDIAVTPFTVPHDAVDPVGFVFEAEGARIAMVTDLGYIPPNVSLQMKGCDVLMLESNHDLDMLRDGPYPWALKQRVMSRLGHLSNEAAAAFLSNTYDRSAAYIVLAHLSESNNLPQLAAISARNALGVENAADVQLLIAKQDGALDPIVL